MKCRFEDVEVYYEVFGTGEDDTPLVFLHGWGGSTKSFEYFAKAMCSCRKVVLIDLPPFGNSTESKNVWNVEKYAQCVLEILNQLGAKRCDIVAHSFGGRVAILLAGEYNICNRLMLTGCAGINKKSFGTKIKIKLYKIKKLLCKCGLISKSAIQNKGSEDYQSLSPVMKQTFCNIVNYDERYLFEKISCPTLLVWGIDDRASPFCWTKIFKKHIKDCEIIKLTGGHFAYLENASKFLRIMQSFLANL